MTRNITGIHNEENAHDNIIYMLMKQMKEFFFHDILKNANVGHLMRIFYAKL